MTPHPIVCRHELLDGAEHAIERYPGLPYGSAILLASDELRRANYQPRRRTRTSSAIRAERSALFLEQRHHGGHRR